MERNNSSCIFQAVLFTWHFPILSEWTSIRPRASETQDEQDPFQPFTWRTGDNGAILVGLATRCPQARPTVLKRFGSNNVSLSRHTFMAKPSSHLLVALGHEEMADT